MKKLLTTLSILLIATAVIAQGEVYTETELKIQLPFGESNSTESSKTYTVERVIDGDTLKLTNGETVHLIGIDAPETDRDKAAQLIMGTDQDLETITKMGQEATEFIKNILKTKGRLHLEFDVQQKDKYGRLLAYVFAEELRDVSGPIFDKYEGKMIGGRNGASHLVKDGKVWLFLNSYIIGQGYATPMTIPPNVKYADLFQKLYQEARDAKRGLWK